METQRRRRVARLILLAGILAAAATYTWGVVETRRAEREIKALELKCETESAQGEKLLAAVALAGNDSDQDTALKAWRDWKSKARGKVRLSELVDQVYAERGGDVNDSLTGFDAFKQAVSGYLRTCSAEKLWADGYGQDVLLTRNQEDLRDTYKERIFTWYSNAALYAGIVVALFAIPWLWYFALDRLRELSAAIQGRTG